MPELTAPFVFKNDEKRIVYGPVLIPDEPDTDDDTVTAEQIETVAHKFVEEYGNVDLMHSLNNVGRLVESYILPMDLQVDDNLTVPKGSWMMGVRVTDEDSWNAVKNGGLGGFSIMAMQKAAMKSAEKSEKSQRITLADLGEDWIVNAVSLVDEPAVPKAKFIAIKSKAKKQQVGEITEETVQKAIDGSMEHKKQLVRRKVYQTFDTERTDSYVHSTFEDTVIVRIEDYISDQRKMYQIDYDIDEQGNVTFSGQPQEVVVQETVVPATETNPVDPFSGLASLNSKEKEESGDAEKPGGDDEGVFAKIFKKLGIRSSEKAGRTISDANLNKLKAAKEVIDELLSVGENERQSTKSVEGGKEMNEEQVKAMIDESTEEINSKLDDVIKSLKASATGEQQEEENGQEDQEGQSSEKKKDDKKEEQQEETSTKSKGEGDSGADEEDYKEMYESAMKELEKAQNKPFSFRLSGQDGAEKGKGEEEETDNRNAFGFKRK